MKTILYISFFVYSFSLAAQDYNIIKSSIGVGFAPNDLKTHLFEVEYQRHIAIGINVTIGYITADGGVSLSNLFNEKDYESVVSAQGSSMYESLGGKPLGSYYNFSGWKIGLQKNITLTNKIEMGISIATLKTFISESEITNINYDENNNIIAEELITKFATFSRFGAEVGLHLEHQISSYLFAGVSTKYQTSSQFIIPNIFLRVTF